MAAVGPYIQVPSAGTYAVPVDPVKPQSLTIASSSTHGRSKSGKHLSVVFTNTHGLEKSNLGKPTVGLISVVKDTGLRCLDNVL